MTIQQRSLNRETGSDGFQETGARDSALLKSQPKKLVFDWNEIPTWMHDNVFITGGYRRQTDSYKECINSLWYLHNESVNIWSHLLAYFLFVGFGIHFLRSQPFEASITVFDYVYFFLFIAGALMCLGFSATFHCFSCHSEAVAHKWNRCDYAGITCLIVGSFFPVIYYGFHCHRLFQVTYMTIIVTMGAATATVTLMQHFRTPAYRWIRVTLFVALGLFGVVPTAHGIWMYGLDNANKTIALSHMILMAVSYIGGALIYGCRFPERLRPGTFNYFGASHQIFHICVVIALLAHYTGVLSAMAFWHDPINQDFCSRLFI